MRILGIDLGQFSIKAIEIKSTFGRFEIHQLIEKKWNPFFLEINSQKNNQKDAINEILQTLEAPPDRIITGLSPINTTFRNFHFPTRNKKKIQSTIRFELEDDLPFSEEECAYDSTTLSQNKEGSLVHVSATLKKYLHTSTEFWNQTLLCPDVITSPTWAYQSLFNEIFSETKRENPLLFLHLGHQSSTFYLHWKSTPLLLRKSFWAGESLTTAISKAYSVSLEKAEAIKHERASLQEETSEQDKTLKICIEEAFKKLLPELNQIKLMARVLTHEQVKCVYLAGGPSLLPGIAPWLKEKLKMPVEPLPCVSAISPSHRNAMHQTDASFSLAAGLGLSFIRSNRSRCINFRKGMFAKQSPSREIHFSVLKKPLMGAVTIVLSFFLNLMIESKITRSELASTHTLLERNIRSFFGPLSPSALKTYLSSMNTLRSSIHRELNKKRELNKIFGPNQQSPLEILKILSASIPKDSVTDLLTFQAGFPPTESFSPHSSDRPGVSLSFLISNPQISEKIAESLNLQMSDLHKGKMEELSSTDSALKKWKISFSGKINDQTSPQ